MASLYGYGEIRQGRPEPNYLGLDRAQREEAYKAVGERVISGSEIFPRAQFYNYCRQNGLWLREVTGFDPDGEPEKLDAYSPIRHVRSEYPPTILLHGDRDRDVPFEESRGWPRP